jgi:preprotein translocase subunit SecE
MASAEVETVASGADKAKLAVALLLVMGGFVAFYLLSAQGALVQWLVLLLGLVAGAGVFLVSEPGKRLMGFGKDSWREVQKVVWPTRREAIQMTAYVFAFVFVMAIFLWLTDELLGWVLYNLILGWR